VEREGILVPVVPLEGLALEAVADLEEKAVVFVFPQAAVVLAFMGKAPAVQGVPQVVMVAVAVAAAAAAAARLEATVVVRVYIMAAKVGITAAAAAAATAAAALAQVVLFASYGPDPHVHFRPLMLELHKCTFKFKLIRKICRLNLQLNLSRKKLCQQLSQEALYPLRVLVGVLKMCFVGNRLIQPPEPTHGLPPLA
jgi:hypothetical protein